MFVTCRCAASIGGSSRSPAAILFPTPAIGNEDWKGSSITGRVIEAPIQSPQRPTVVVAATPSGQFPGKVFPLTMISIDLSGKLALITGATSELGRVMARTLARCNADVVVHYHSNRELAESLVAEIGDMGRKAIAVRADVTEKRSVDDMRESANSALGSPDIVVTNAVIRYEWKAVLDQSPADYESQFRSCVLQNVLISQTFIPAMIEKAWGRVIAISTECAMQCWKTQSAYVSGKRGMDGALRVLAREVGEHGITVNQIAPGWTISENRPESDDSKRYRDQVPLRRRGKDHEIANVVAFLASDLASFITGAYIPVCGGNVMPGI